MDRRVLLRDVNDLCDAFFHVKETPEASVLQHCLRTSGCCSGKTTCLIAQLVAVRRAFDVLFFGTLSCLAMSVADSLTAPVILTVFQADGSEQFLRLYRNQAQSSCAEGFLQRDEALLACVERAHASQGKGAMLNIYLTQQPCHYSSSNDSSSCTDNLRRWWKEWLEPRGVVGLRIKAAYPYRTHWDEKHMSEDDLAGLGRRKWARGKGGGKGGGGKGGAIKKGSKKR